MATRIIPIVDLKYLQNSQILPVNEATDLELQVVEFLGKRNCTMSGRPLELVTYLPLTPQDRKEIQAIVGGFANLLFIEESMNEFITSEDQDKYILMK